MPQRNHLLRKRATSMPPNPQNREGLLERFDDSAVRLSMATHLGMIGACDPLPIVVWFLWYRRVTGLPVDFENTCTSQCR